MTRKQIMLLLTTLGIVILLSTLLFPRSYNAAPFIARNSTQYWDLETVSHIGYTKIASAATEKKNPILYLHGGPGGTVSDETIEALRPLSELGHDLFFYDQIGSGHSNRLNDIGEYTVKRHQQDLHEIVLKTGHKKVILIGHSWGAMLAINYLQDYAESVDRIILSGPGPILPINKSINNTIAPDSLLLRNPAYSNAEGNKKAYNLRSKLIRKWALRFNSKLASDNEADAFFTHLNQELNKSTECEWKGNKKYRGGSGYYSHIMTIKSFSTVADKRAELKKLATPILLIRGQCDNQQWGYTKEYMDIFPNSRLEIIKDAGHNIISSNKERYYNLIRDFLSEE